VSEEFVLKLLTMVAPLLYVILGSLISVLSTWGLERRKWQRERQEKLATLKRDALAAALEWIQPMRNAQIRASSLVMSAIQGEVDNEQFLEQYPYLLGDLVKKELPGCLQAVLPKGSYARGQEIVRSLDDLQYLGIKHGEQARVMGKVMSGFQECSEKLDVLGKQIAALETDLRRTFLDTFE
jgi:hypothetical protein